ncbi:MAG: hypothetical protein WC412_05100 [Candidatus Omnitrophota bacterium]|jgi:uncharacterized protein YehS (DUF1456 family)
MIMQIRSLMIYSLLVLASGCATVEHLDELFTLKNVSDNQRDIDIYLKKQEKGFSRLLDDIKNNRLLRGKSKRLIIEDYSEPVLVKKVEAEDNIIEVLLYRKPTEYFSSDRVYLYINNKGKLAYWELKPADK